ncbi:MAG: uracil-DNA glycosylase, partial [Acidocella sp. 20-61-6]
MDELAALRLQIIWGADEILLPEPQNRRAAKAAAAEPVAVKLKPPPLASVLPAGPAEAVKIADGCASLEDLAAALRDFSGCALRDTATHLVFADGAADARVMVIGDAPGAEEDRTGKPFAGPAGQLLDKMLASIGLNRGNVRLANIVPWRPPGDRPPTEAEIAVC